MPSPGRYMVVGGHGGRGGVRCGCDRAANLVSESGGRHERGWPSKTEMRTVLSPIPMCGGGLFLNRDIPSASNIASASTLH